MSATTAVRPQRVLRPGRYDTGNYVLDLALTLLDWHGVRAGQTQAICMHCMPDTPWPCPAWDLAQHAMTTLSRNEPYGPPGRNPYLAECARADLGHPGY